MTDDNSNTDDPGHRSFSDLYRQAGYTVDEHTTGETYADFYASHSGGRIAILNCSSRLSKPGVVLRKVEQLRDTATIIHLATDSQRAAGRLREFLREPVQTWTERGGECYVRPQRFTCNGETVQVTEPYTWVVTTDHHPCPPGAMLSMAIDETGTPQIEDEASLRWHRNTKQNGVAVDDAETLTAASENAAESHKDVLTVREPFVPRRTDYHELVTITVVVDGTLTEYDPTAPPATEHASKTADQRSDAHGERPGLQSPPASQSPTEHEDRHRTRQRDEPDARFSTTSTNGEGTTPPPATTIQALTQPSQVHLLPHSAWHGRSR